MRLKTFLRSLVAIGVAATCAAATESQPAADWPQWRGPNRNGIAVNSPKLLDAWPKEGPLLLWKSDWIPGYDEGGMGSPVVADGKVFLNLTWKRPKTGKDGYRFITDDVLEDAGWRQDLPDELCKKIEAAWSSQNRPSSAEWKWFTVERRKPAELDAFLAKHAELDKYIKDFIASLDPKDAAKYGSYIKRRLCISMPRKKSDEPDGLAWESLVKLSALRNVERKLFTDWAKELERQPGVNHGFIETAKKRSYTFSDTLVCLDAATGKELWRYEMPVENGKVLPDGICLGQGYHPERIDMNAFGCCGTPAVLDGKCAFMGATGLNCVSTKGGKLLWRADVPPTHASVLMDSKAVYATVVGKGIAAYDLNTGAIAWSSSPVSGGVTTSPIFWETNGKRYIIANGPHSTRLVNCLEVDTGKAVWSIPQSKVNVFAHATPVVSGDILVVAGDGTSTMGFRITQEKAEALWKISPDCQSSPIVHNGYLYYVITGEGSDRWFCRDVKTGELKWSQVGGKGVGLVSSPILADGKIFMPMGCGKGNGRQMGFALDMVNATPEKFVQLGSFNAQVTPDSSPAIAGGFLFVRVTEGIACYDLRAK